jgi:hypothetical protein
MSHIKKSTIYEINRRLGKIFGDELYGFKNAMQEANALISGSFIIQCILGEHWPGSDVDVYISERMFHEFFTPDYYESLINLSKCNFVSDESDYDNSESDDRHKKQNYESDDSELSECEDVYDRKNMLQYMKDKNYCVEKIHKDYHGNPGTVVDYRINGTKIQFIGESQKNGFVISGYDYNICKNTYKYDDAFCLKAIASIHSAFEQNECDVFDSCVNLFIYRINDILTKYTNFSVKYDLKRNVKRYLKYRDRGFNFYACNKSIKVTDENIWGHLGIGIIKLHPIDESYCYCKMIMESNNYEFKCTENVVHRWLCDERKRNTKTETLKVCGTEKIPNMYLYPCVNNYFKCLFDYIYPNASHFHSSVGSKHCIFVLDDFDVVLS